MLEKLFERFRERPEIKALVADEERLAVAQRAALAGQLSALQAEQLAAFNGARDARVPLQAEVARSEALAASARERLFDHDRAHSIATHDSWCAAERIRWALLASASPSIAAFVEELRAELQATYARRDTVTKPNILGDERFSWSNAQSIAQRAEAIRAAIAECGEAGSLLYEPLDEVALAAKFDEMRRLFPAVEQPPVSILDTITGAFDRLTA